MKKQDIDKLLDKYRKRGYAPSQALSSLLKDLKKLSKTKKFSAEITSYVKDQVLLKQRGRIGQYRSPNSLVKFIVDLAPLEKDAIVLDPTCGTGSFLLEAGKRERSLKLYGVDIDSEIIEWARFFASQGSLNVRCFRQDSLQPFPKELPLADIAFSSLPFGGMVSDSTLMKSFGVGTRSLEGLLMQKILQSLKEGGLAFVIVPEGFLFRRNLLPLRKYLAKEASLQAVIGLPQGIFAPSTGITCSILVMKKSKGGGDTLLLGAADEDSFPLLAEEYRGFINKKKLSLGKVVSDFAERDSWSVKHYFNELEVENMLKEQAKGKTLVRLGDVTVLKGSKVKDLREGKVPFDLILASRFTPGNVVTSLDKLKSKSDRSYYIAVKAQERKVLPKYLYYLLKTRLFKEQVKLYESGLTIRGISVESLKRIKVPVATLPEQRKIIDLATKASSYIDDLKLKIELVENRLRDNIFEIEEISKEIYQSKVPKKNPLAGLPRTIAIPYGAYKATTSLDKKYDLLKVCFEITLKTIGMMILLATKDSDGMKGRIRKIDPNRPIPNGVWKAVILGGLDLLSGSDCFLSDHADGIDKDSLKTNIEELNKLRIKEAHPFSALNEFQKGETVEQFGRLLEGFIKEFIFLTDYPLVYFQSASKRHNKVSHTVKYLVGDMQSIKEGEEILKELFSSELYFLSHSYGKSLLLAPLIVYEDCPKCRCKEILFFNFIEKGVPKYGGCPEREVIALPEYLDDLEKLFS